MFVQYKPRGGEQQSWDFVPEDLFQSQAELIEKRYAALGGQPNFEAFLDGVRHGEAKARRVLLWHLIRLTHHNLRFEDTPDFRVGELTVDFSSVELRELMDKLDKVEDPPAGVRARLQEELTDALLRERGDEGLDALDDEPAGKAGSDS